MTSFYDAAFGINLAVCVFLRLGSNYLLKDKKKDEEKTSETPVSTLEQQRLFKSFQFQWLFVYMTFMAADWLQGPYFYSLYSSYGFTETQIAIFFLAGFTSGMIFGTFIGSLADKHGRKKLSIVCGVLYGTACAIRFINDRDVIVVSHILSGISSSLLHSVFEVWMITEHSKRSFPQHLLSETLSWATFLNGIVSIVAGVSATFLVQIYGVQGPFGASSMLFFLGALIVSLTWNENYGDQKTEFNQAFGNAVKRLFAEPRFISLGLIQSLFETTMYTFVFLWAPCLTAATESDEPLPFGTIFANLMVSIMIGSSVFSIMMRLNVQLINIAKILFVIAAIAMYSCSLFITGPHLLGLFFCVFEFCCGIYFPALGTLKAITVPDEMRSTMSNLFRIPLNFMVMIVLLKVDDFDKTTLFFICVGELLLGLLLCFFFQAKTEEENARASRLPSNSESK